MFYALSFLLIVYIAGVRRKNKIRQALNNYDYRTMDYRERQQKDADIQKFYDNNLQKNKYV